ncbi:putative murein hydrolase (TIGR00659 family) [Paenibacillus sp. BK033]|uniref:LrgB family protein n=1 Tax=Paenibacillus sp. BK033 TaxID=2512133 RepID=UPI00105200BE|nr:LrgB family protein [Paenibacillus sp. BK033]TCN01249.1 putative murein hydrolase (TIGR00659 family) [Paenibacillus sp. BK033]
MIMEAVSLLITVVVYMLAQKIYRYKPIMLLSPLIVTPLVLIVLLAMTRTSYADYNTGAHWLSDMLGPATIAFAIPLSRHYDLVKKHAAQIMISVFTGSAAAVASSLWLAQGFGLNDKIIYSLIPHSATTPIAMNVSQSIGGIPTITAVAVMVTGIFGSLVGPPIIRLFRIRNEVARGVLLGTSAHGAGTSKAFELGSISGTVSSVSMILTAIITLFLTPLLLGH